jgi:two-component system response regulator GlrR
MSESVNTEGAVPAPWLNPEGRQVFAEASVLLVEDDDDIRELIVTLFELASFDVTACASAEAALEQLREQPFDMVLTDYMLPNRTGAWLLDEASREGLLDSTPVLVVSAHPNPPVNGFEVLPKPFDLDELIERVRSRLDASTRRAKLALPAGAVGKPGGDGEAARPNTPVELVLYVSAHSPRSAHALENIRKVIARFAPDRIRLTICDLPEDPSKGIADAVVFTPTLVLRSPGPRTFILGHLSDPDVLTELLEGCGQELMPMKVRPPTN